MQDPQPVTVSMIDEFEHHFLRRWPWTAEAFEWMTENAQRVYDALRSSEQSPLATSQKMTSPGTAPLVPDRRTDLALALLEICEGRNDDKGTIAAAARRLLVLAEIRMKQIARHS